MSQFTRISMDYSLNVRHFILVRNFSSSELQRQKNVLLLPPPDVFPHTRRNLLEIIIKSNPNQNVFTMHRLIWNPFGTDTPFGVSVCWPNQSVHGKYSLILGWFDKIWKRFLCVDQEIQKFYMTEYSGTISARITVAVVILFWLL